MNTVEITKTELRENLHSKLRGLSESELSEKSKSACKRLLQTKEFEQADTVMLYLSLPHEVETAELILHCWQMGKLVVVPKVSWQQRHMIPVMIKSLETGIEEDHIGLKNPVTGVPFPSEDIDLVITPGVGFDLSGNRLGRGGAFYDRFFSHKTLKAFKLGLAFHEQIIDAVPTDEHDEKVNCLITDEVTEYFN